MHKPKKRTELEGIYTVTLAKLDVIEKCVLDGMSIGKIEVYLRNECGWDLTQRRCRRLITIAKERMRRRFRNNFDENFVFIQENLCRVLNEALTSNDRKDQLKVLNMMMKLYGLDEQKIKNTLNINNGQVANIDLLFQ